MLKKKKKETKKIQELMMRAEVSCSQNDLAERSLGGKYITYCSAFSVINLGLSLNAYLREPSNT